MLERETVALWRTQIEGGRNEAWRWRENSIRKQIFTFLPSNQLKIKTCTEKKRPGSRTRKRMTRHPPKEINSITKYFNPGWIDHEVRRERTVGGWDVVGDCLPCHGDIWWGPFLKFNVILIIWTKLVVLLPYKKKSFSGALPKFSFHQIKWTISTS